ncbi:hypothetical protein ACO2Q3_02315 [Caulobacter sp. KR2-114]|uniref:hypothetical protein n=1 Tax=Caulobacter sp. KR2-114 TaxID=3400912 RepID=UPI003C042FD4
MTLERLPSGVVEAPLSWSSIIGGALVAVATSVFLGLLAAGFGLELASSGVASRGSLHAFTPQAGAIAVAIQVIAGAFGGYVAGRLRTIWTETHADESHLRDTAHGLIAWALATVLGVALAMLVVIPYADSLAPAAAAAPPPSPAEADRAAHIAAQSAFFAAIGLILAAFVSAVAARLGGQQAEHMHLRHLARG